MTGFGVKVRGVEDVRAMLAEVGPREGRNLIRVTVFDVAKQTAEAAKVAMPKGAYHTGTMEGATHAKRERGTPGRVHSTVRVGRQAFYWRFLEFGDGPDRVEHGMFGKAVQGMRTGGMDAFLEAFARKFEAAMRRQRKRQAR